MIKNTNKNTNRDNYFLCIEELLGVSDIKRQKSVINVETYLDIILPYRRPNA